MGRLIFLAERVFMDYSLFPLLLLGGLAAGFVNTLAGGGSMLTLPLLIMIGLPANVANGTNRVAILIQNTAAILGFRSKGVTAWRTGLWLCLPVCLGAAAGSLVAVELDPLLLQRIFGVVLVVFCFVVFIRPAQRLRSPAEAAGKAGLSLKTFLLFLGIGFWGGFAQVGVGFLLLAGLILCVRVDLVYANVIKVLLVFSYTGLSLAIFGLNGQVEIVPGLVMAMGNATGAWIASVLSVKKGAPWVRTVLIVTALLASLKLLGVIDLLLALFNR